MKIAILIPCYNEEQSIGKVVKDFRKEVPEADIYVYDNNSTDKTVEVAKEAGAIIRHEYNQGKGNVVRRMFREVEADIYVMVDGDDTYPAEDVHKLIIPIAEERADMTTGNRISNGSYKKENKRLFHDFGNNLVKNTINRLFRSKLKDIMTGYRAFSKKFVKNMPVLSQGFEIETEITLYALDKLFIIKEIPITYRNRQSGSKSKINTIPDGIRVIKKIVSMYKDYRPRRFFFIIAAILIVLGFIVGTPVIVEYFETRYIHKLPSAVLATGIVTLGIIVAQCGAILDTIVKQHRESFENRLLKYEEMENLKKKLQD